MTRIEGLYRGRTARRTLVPLLAAAFLSGCTTWRTQSASAPEVIARDEPERVRVTRLGGERIVLFRPVVERDTLYGFRTSRTARGVDRPASSASHAGDPERVAIPVQDVVRLELRKLEPVGTSLLVGLGALTLAGVIGAAAGGGGGGGGGGGTGDGTTTFSCPLVYSWDGEGWRLDSGTFGGAIFRPLARADLDNLEHAVAESGRLRLRLANELAETDHVDAVAVLAVDHEPGLAVAPDGDGGLHALGGFLPPRLARDHDGADVRELVLLADGRVWESARLERDTARPADLRDGLELAFDRPTGAREAKLVLDAHNSPWAAFLVGEYVRMHGRQVDAWYDSLNSDGARARRLGAKLAREGFLRVSVWTGEGWEDRGLVWEAGPEVMKRQVVRLDLRGIAGTELRVRLESIPAFWRIDRVAVDYTPDRPLRVRKLAPAVAVDREGRDVSDLLAAEDGIEYVLEPGDAAELVFDVPPVPDGLGRTYLLRSAGWYRIHAPAAGEPESELLARVEGEEGAIARLAVARLSEAVSKLADGRAP